LVLEFCPVTANTCGCYTPTYLSLDGKQIIDDPSTPPVHTYSAAVQLTAGKTYTLSISGDSSQLLWGTPAALAPGLTAAANAAKAASVAVRSRPSWSRRPATRPNASAVVHATATIGDLQREAGVTVTVTG